MEEEPPLLIPEASNTSKSTMDPTNAQLGKASQDSTKRVFIATKREEKNNKYKKHLRISAKKCLQTYSIKLQCGMLESRTRTIVLINTDRWSYIRLSTAPF